MSTRGLGTALAEAADAAGVASGSQFSGAPGGEQLDLLRGDDGRLPKNVFQLARTRGRPPGARNKRNQDLSVYLVQKYGDPADALGNVMNMDWQTLRDLWVQAQRSEDKSKPVRIRDVAEFWLKCVLELMDRVHGKAVQHLAVDGKVDGFIFAPNLLPPGGASREKLILDFATKMATGISADDIRELQAGIAEGEFTEVEE